MPNSLRSVTAFELNKLNTFNRSWLAGLVIIRFVEWFVANTPKNLHVLRLFIKPRELAAACQAAGLTVAELRGMRPKLWSRAFAKLLWTRTVDPAFRFEFTKSTALAYLGYAVKRGG